MGLTGAVMGGKNTPFKEFSYSKKKKGLEVTF